MKLLSAREAIVPGEEVGMSVEPFFSTPKGQAYLCSIEDFLNSKKAASLKGKVNLILTSPPYPLVIPKKYGNMKGTEYLNWMSELSVGLAELLTEDGSMVVEIGNAWTPKSPTMSTLPVETLISIGKSADLNVCQQLIWNNPSKLPGPAFWVNIKRERVTDSFTHIWWYSKSEHPKANNRNVLQPYKPGMEKLIARQSYNSGARPSGHRVSKEGFLTHNGGSIPHSVLNYSNTGTDNEYRDWCKENDVPMHPARMPITVADFFIKFLTDPKDLVLDPFGGSCTTGKSAENLKRRWICVEREQDYLFGAKGRFQNL
jgi:site-specific DNA-methyltransferase (cytosine-N4-specific)